MNKAHECTKHDGDSMDLDECAECIAWMDGEERYWAAYFGKARIKAETQALREEREDHGRELTDGERMDEARRLK